MRARLTEPLEKWRRGLDYRRLLFVSLAVIGLLTAAILVASIATARSTSLCAGACHVVNPQSQSWNRSSHESVPCYACHVGGSALDWVRHVTVDQPSHISNLLRLGNTRPINSDNGAAADITNDRCLRCHPDVRREQTNGRSGRYRKRHREHSAAGVRCTECHNRTAHSNAEKYAPLRTRNPSFRYNDFATMRAGCWRCHSTQAGVRSDELLDELGLTDFPPTACRTCHERASGPRGGTLDHVGDDWREGRHGRVAARNYDVCLPCHPRQAADSNRQVSDCTECHAGVTMPHNMGTPERYYETQTDRPKWSREHAEYDAASDACKLCHAADEGLNVCAQCHHRDYLLGTDASLTPWPEAHQIITKEMAPNCQKCHMIEFCAYCHAQGKTPPPGQYFYKLNDR